MGEADPVLACEHASAAYDGGLALEDVTCAIGRGARVAVLGPNGAGKSTLFKAAAGLLPLRAGRLTVRGRPAGAPGAEVTYVPQREEVDWRFPVTVADVVMMGRYGRLGLFRRPGAADRAAVSAALEEVGLAGHARTHVAALSGGQQQRVFLARALAQENDVLLLDEPFTGVDAATEATLFEVLDRLRAQGATVVVATHDLNKATSHFDQLLLIRHTLVAYGPPGEVFTPDVLRQTFGQQVTIVPCAEGTAMVTDFHHHPHETDTLHDHDEGDGH